MRLSMPLTQPLEVDFKSMRTSELSSDLDLESDAGTDGEVALLDIGEVAARSGMAPSALRYYESEQIIASVDRKGLRRQFQPDVLTTLAVVAMCREAGFTLEEIKLVLATGGGPSWKSFAAHKRDQLRARAEHLGTVADQLDHALRCPSPNVFDCEHFRAALAAALPVRGDVDRPPAGRGIDGR
jgi:DNA-binding transcriptional MerR regulator